MVYDLDMRLLSLDYDPVYGDDTTLDTFSGDVSAFDFDVVVWDPTASFWFYRRDTGGRQYRNLPWLSEHTSVQMQADIKRRRAEFLEFVNSGRVLVVIVRPPQECYIDTGERTYSGTGRNRHQTNHLALLDLLEALPMAADCKFVRASGKRIDFDGDGPLVALLRKYKIRFEYEAFMSAAPGVSLAHVSGTDRTVGSIQRTEAGGYFILLPAINLKAEHDAESDEQPDDEDRWISEAPQFQADLLSAIEQLSGSKSVSRPVWADWYATEEQQRIRTEVVKQQGRIETARAKLARMQQQAEAATSKDQLFLGSGRALELEVKSVLEVLGGTVTEPEPGRDDWRVDFPEGGAVVEVKGVGKSAAEKHAAQLEKWVSGAMEETGTLPKGILIVNTWRELPLGERVKVDFPEQMLPYCKSRGHCLITGLQLFVMRADVEKDPKRAEHWRKLILGTAGQLDGCDDWRSIIQEIKQDA